MSNSTIIIIVVVVIIFLLIYFVFDKCPKCGKSGGMKQIDKKEIDRQEYYDSDKDGNDKLMYRITYETKRQCKHCGYTDIHREVRKINA